MVNVVLISADLYYNSGKSVPTTMVKRPPLARWELNSNNGQPSRMTVVVLHIAPPTCIMSTSLPSRHLCLSVSSIITRSSSSALCRCGSGQCMSPHHHCYCRTHHIVAATTALTPSSAPSRLVLVVVVVMVMIWHQP